MARIMKIPFSKAHISHLEMDYIQKALQSDHISGNGSFTKSCETWLEKQTGTKKSLLVHSCTAALEMSALLIDLQPGDEVIMPSFTFVSTANAVVLRGATPVFVDIRPDTLNMDETKIEEAITSKTKAIFVVHYAGVACEMDFILEIARKRNLFIVEDAAQGVMASYKNKALGTIGDFGCFSFHETKNLVSGEGGALLVNREDQILKAEIIREKGTNRTSFLRKEVAYYTWLDVGSSYICSDILAAVLLAQLERAEELQASRLSLWQNYHDQFLALEQAGLVRRPTLPKHCQHNGHIYYLVCESKKAREAVIAQLREVQVTATFHYIPLHASPAGQKYGRTVGDLRETLSISDHLVRLPIWYGMKNQEKIIEIVRKTLQGRPS